MSLSSSRRLAAIATLVLLCSIPLRAADAPPAPAQTGDLWEVTSQMSMEGSPMKMPSQTQKVCSPKEWKEPPAPADDHQKCEYSDFKMEGSKATWKVSCTGRQPMTGTGEITRDGAEAYTGKMKFSFSGGSMSMNLSGKRVGACDPAAK